MRKRAVPGSRADVTMPFAHLHRGGVQSLNLSVWPFPEWCVLDILYVAWQQAVTNERMSP